MRQRRCLNFAAGCSCRTGGGRRQRAERREAVMVTIVEDIYKSSNGDCWRLIRDTSTARAVVRHEPSPASGGNVTDTNVEDFLRIDGPGPEFAALRRLLRQSPNRASSAEKDD